TKISYLTGKRVQKSSVQTRIVINKYRIVMYFNKPGVARLIFIVPDDTHIGEICRKQILC
ncbi:unnamed protein product, partial [Heterotrigona itama]